MELESALKRVSFRRKTPNRSRNNSPSYGSKNFNRSPAYKRNRSVPNKRKAMRTPNYMKKQNRIKGKRKRYGN